MNATETYQVQVDPGDEIPGLEGYDHPLEKRTWVKLTLGRILHPIGVHTWVRWLHYDSASKRVLMMNGVICAFCSKAKLT